MHSQLAANLRTLCMAGGRVSGTPNAEQAQQFVADKLREYGLQHVHFEPFEMQSWIMRQTRVELLTDPPRILDGAVALGNTLSTPPGGVTAEIVDLGDVQEADFAAPGDTLRGRFVLVRDGGLTRRDKLRLACAQGAAGLLVMSGADHEPVIGTGHPEPRPEPAVVIRHDEELPKLLAAGQPVRANIQLITEDWEARPNNVVGEIEGRGPQAREVIIVCAHLDSWHLAEGAIDNATGSATILEVARALTRVGWRPQRTIRFIWFMGEEHGLFGSRAYVEQHGRELDHIAAVINVDMPGAPRTIATFGNSALRPAVDEVCQALPGYELDVEVAHPFGANSDHAPFVARGVGAVVLWGDIGPGGEQYHTSGDVYDAVDRRATTAAAVVIAVLTRHLADAELPRASLTTMPTAETVR